MITAGLKLTQGGGIALIRDDTLEFSVEVEKLDNGPRFGAIEDLELLPGMLASQDYDLDEVDEWVVDGWEGPDSGTVRLLDNGAPVALRVAPYREGDWLPDPLRPGHRGGITLGGRVRSYTSYLHTTGHVAGAYCTSPFAGSDPSMVLVWDDGSFPLLYHVDRDGRVEAGGDLFPFLGYVLGEMARRLRSRRRRRSGPTDRYLDPVIEYPTHGTPRDDLTAVLRELFEKHFDGDTPDAKEFRQTVVGCGSTGEPSYRYVRAFVDEVCHHITPLAGDNDADIVASMREFAGELLLARLVRRASDWKGDDPFNLCFTGGRALDVGWSTALRDHPMIRAMWVPPFADESGSAIGVAAAHLGHQEGLRKLNWELRAGPAPGRHPHLPSGWSVSPCRPEELARLLHRTGEPVVVVSGRAKLGPRALGTRSILAPAVDPAIRGRLNRVKGRDARSPVAAICLTDHAVDVFDPGTPDPYLQYQHRIRPPWRERLPAVGYEDGTTRLQTVDAVNDPTLAAILREYRTWSGIPVLCHTSAHREGRGVFPDALSAMRWGEIRLVWSDNILYRQVHSSHD